MSATRLGASLALMSTLVLPIIDRADAAPPPTRTVQTRGFTVQIPKDWSLHKRIEYGEDKRRITWEYKSPKRNYRFRATIAKDRGGTLQKVIDDAIVRLARRVDDLEIVQKAVDAKKGYAHVVAKTLMIRKKSQQPYLVLQVLVRPAGHKYVIGLYVAGSGEKLDQFQKVAQPILESLKLKEPKALFGVAAAAKPARARPAAPARAKPMPIKKR